MAGLDGYGLKTVTWEAADEPLAGCLVASPADAEGRGIALTVKCDGAAVDLTGASVYLLWRHQATRARGCEPFEAVDASAGSFRVYWPSAMAAHEGVVDAQVMVSLDDGTAIGSRTFSVGVEQELVTEPGEGGSDGFSPIATVAQTETGALISVTDATGTTTATVLHGQKGDKGDPGEPGADGADGIDGQDGAFCLSPCSKAMLSHLRPRSFSSGSPRST